MGKLRDIKLVTTEKKKELLSIRTKHNLIQQNFFPNFFFVTQIYKYYYSNI